MNDMQSNNISNDKSAFLDAQNLYGKQPQPIARPEKNIGIDTEQTLWYNIIQAGETGKLDMSSLEAFTRVSQNRDQILALIDLMSEDSTINAILETYAEDATEYNTNGQIVWAESEDPDIAKYVNFLLESIRVDKNIYNWVHSLCKYGDLYLRLFRKSDYQKDEQFLFGNKDTENKNVDTADNNILNEDVSIKAYAKNDRYEHYLEKVANPGEMFELTRFGKTFAYIQAPMNIIASFGKNDFNGMNTSNGYGLTNYKFDKRDVNIYDATTFVHACLEDNSSRQPEKVSIFLPAENDNEQETGTLEYTVKRGQSLLYNVFKIWRELALLENSILLNRVTKSAIVRVIGVEVGDMPKEQVGPHLQNIKSLMEQKTALDVGNSMSEYTNPGPVENNIYIPTRNGLGAITTSQVGGDVNVGELTDLDYFKNKFFGALRVPKQYFGDTDDATGFNGGSSLTIISSRYAKMIKRIQNTMIQAITDAINLFLINKELKHYVNNFTIKMTPPTTQEDIDRRENTSSKVQLASDVINMLDIIEDNKVKLELIKTLLSDILVDPEVLNIVQEYIDKLPDETEKSLDNPDDMSDGESFDDMDISSIDSEGTGDFDIDLSGDLTTDIDTAMDSMTDDTESAESDEMELPNPEDLGAGDFTDNNNTNL